MAKSQVFSLWAMPEPGSPLAARVAALIQDLSRQYGTPPFEPHVTVLGGFGEPQGLGEEEVIRRIGALTTQLAPYSLHVADASFGSSYFQSVYLRMVKADEVLEASAAATACFDMKKDARPDYMPHMSLLYGDLEKDVREQIVREVEAKHKDLLVDASFLVRNLHLYRTDTADRLMKSWEKIGEFPLRGQV